MDERLITKKWHVFKGHEAYDYEETRAILIRVFSEDSGHTIDDANNYLAKCDRDYGDGYCWIGETLVEY